MARGFRVTFVESDFITVIEENIWTYEGRGNGGMEEIA